MRQTIFILITSLGLLLTYNNCSDVGFSQAPVTPTGVGENASSLGLNGLSDDQLLQRLPPEEQGIYRPVSDLENDPRLAEIYACPDNAGILLCHFPSSLDGEHTLCVGSVNAALTHSGHELSVDANGQVQGDYLGPCKNVPVTQ